MADNDPFDVRFRKKPVESEGGDARTDRPTTPLSRPPERTQAERADKPTTPFDRSKMPQWVAPDDPTPPPQTPPQPPPPRAGDSERFVRAPTPPPVPVQGHRIMPAKTDPGTARNVARAEPDRPVSRSTGAPTGTGGSPTVTPRPETSSRSTGSSPAIGSGAAPAVSRTRTPTPNADRAVSRSTPPAGMPVVTSPRPASRSTPPAGMTAVTPSDSNPGMRVSSTAAPPPSPSSSGTMPAVTARETRPSGTQPPRMPQITTPGITKASTRLGMPAVLAPVVPTLFVEPGDSLASADACILIYRLSLEVATAVFVMSETLEAEHYYIKTELDRQTIAIVKQIAQASGTNNMMQRRTLVQQTRRIAADCLAMLDYLAERSLEANPTEARALTHGLVAELIAVSSIPRT